MIRKRATLTFIIPTYNRVYFLEQGLNRLRSEIETYQFQNNVEIIVGNNCSKDGTEVFLNQWKQDNPELNVKIYHHKTNLGVVKNLVFLIQEAKGKFWMFYGDDDFIPKGVLPDLISYLKTNSDYPVHIFNQTILKPIVKENLISIEECASRYFYYMGNACSVANTKLSHEVIKLNLDEISNTCWPQTAIYFFVLLKNEFQPMVSPLVIFEEQQKDKNNIPNSFYLYDSAYASLVLLAIQIENIFVSKVNFNWFLNGIKRDKSFFIDFIFKRVLLHYFVTDTRDQQKSFKKLLARLFSENKFWVRFQLVKIYILITLLNRKWFLFLFLFSKTLSNSRSVFGFLNLFKINKQNLTDFAKQHEKSKHQLHSHEINQGEW